MCFSSLLLTYLRTKTKYRIDVVSKSKKSNIEASLPRIVRLR